MLVYKVPEFEPIGEFTVNRQQPTAVTAISDCGNHELFTIGTQGGDIYVYKWMPGVGQDPEAQAQNFDNNIAGLFNNSQGGAGLAQGGGMMGGGQSQPSGIVEPAQPSINPFTGQAIGGPAAVPQPGGMGGGQPLMMGGGGGMMMGGAGGDMMM